MPTDCVPPVRLCELSQAEPGSLVMWSGMYGFATYKAMDSEKRPMIAAISVRGNRRRFEYKSGRDDYLLDFGDELLLEPLVNEAPPMEGDPGHGTTLFLWPDGVLGVVVATSDSDTEWAIYNFRTGTIIMANHSRAMSFPRWRLGVKRHGNFPVWLVDV